MSSLEQRSAKVLIYLKFLPLISVPSTGKINLVETSFATITEHAQVQNTDDPIMYTVPISNMAVNQQKTETT